MTPSLEYDLQLEDVYANKQYQASRILIRPNFRNKSQAIEIDISIMSRSRGIEKELHIYIVASFLECSLMTHEFYSENRFTLSQKIRKLFVIVFTQPYILNLIFWFALIFRISYLTDDGYIRSKYISVDYIRRVLKFPDVIIYE